MSSGESMSYSSNHHNPGRSGQNRPRNIAGSNAVPIAGQQRPGNGHPGGQQGSWRQQPGQGGGSAAGVNGAGAPQGGQYPRGGGRDGHRAGPQRQPNQGYGGSGGGGGRHRAGGGGGNNHGRPYPPRPAGSHAPPHYQQTSSHNAHHHRAQGQHPHGSKPPQPTGSSSSSRAPITSTSSSKSARTPSGPIAWGSRSVDIFEIQEQVGEGTYGQVYRARSKETGEMVALKRVRMDNEKEGFPITAIREIKILKSISHPQIVNLKEIVTSPPEEYNQGKGSIYMVFEYMHHDLSGLMESPGLQYFSLPQLKCYIQQLLRGMFFCHRNNILHRDIKASNLLINNDGQLKLADFGLARPFSTNSQSKYTNRVITLWYRPPELLLGANAYGPAVDMWSVGCIIAEVLARKPLFPGGNELELMDRIWKLAGSPVVPPPTTPSAPGTPAEGSELKTPTDPSAPSPSPGHAGPSPTTAGPTSTPEEVSNADPSQIWPGVTKMPWYTHFKPQQFHRRRLKEHFKDFTPEALDLVEKLLHLDPDKRITAEEALDHDWLWTDPVPCDPSEIPKFPSIHEWQAKKKRDAARAARASVSSNTSSTIGAVSSRSTGGAPPVSGRLPVTGTTRSLPPADPANGPNAKRFKSTANGPVPPLSLTGGGPGQQKAPPSGGSASGGSSTAPRAVSARPSARPPNIYNTAANTVTRPSPATGSGTPTSRSASNTPRVSARPANPYARR